MPLDADYERAGTALDCLNRAIERTDGDGLQLVADAGDGLMVTGAPEVLGPEVVTVIGGVVLLTVWVRDAVAVLLFESPL